MASRIKLLMCLVFVLGACASTQPRTTETDEWKGRMQALAANLAYIFPVVSDPVEFQNPANSEKIDSTVSTLAALAHEMNKKIIEEQGDKPNVDPSVKVLAGTFKNDLTISLDAFRRRKYEYSRSSLNAAIHLCIQCHARKENSPAQVAHIDFKFLHNVKPLYQADFYAAARQFDRALDIYQKVIKDENIAKGSPQEWETAVEQSLGIAVKVNDDPQLADKITDLALNSKSARHAFRLRAQAWKDQVQQWESDRLRLKLQKDEFEKAQTLMNYSGNKPSGLINYLRAAGFLHGYVQKTTDPTKSAHAYLALGQCYQVLKQPGEIGLARNYFKTCIFVAPHSSVATKCYDLYEDEIFSDALGGDLPQSTLDYLKFLQELAQPKG